MPSLLSSIPFSDSAADAVRPDDDDCSIPFSRRTRAWTGSSRISPPSSPSSPSSLMVMDGGRKGWRQCLDMPRHKTHKTHPSIKNNKPLTRPPASGRGRPPASPRPPRPAAPRRLPRAWPPARVRRPPSLVFDVVAVSVMGPYVYVGGVLR